MLSDEQRHKIGHNLLRSMFYMEKGADAASSTSFKQVLLDLRLSIEDEYFDEEGPSSKGLEAVRDRIKTLTGG